MGSRGKRARFGATRSGVSQRIVVQSPARRVQQEKPRATLFDEELVRTDASWKEHWWGMPSFQLGNACPQYQVIVNFFTFEDMQEFARRLGVGIQQNTKSLWFPPDVQQGKPGDWEWTDTCWRDSHWGEFKLDEACKCRACTVKRNRTPGK